MSSNYCRKGSFLPFVVCLNLVTCWHILMRMRAPKEGSCYPLGPLDLPHSLYAFQYVLSTDTLNVEGYHTFGGGFWNYFSMGSHPPSHGSEPNYIKFGIDRSVFDPQTHGRVMGMGSGVRPTTFRADQRAGSQAQRRDAIQAENETFHKQVNELRNELQNQHDKSSQRIMARLPLSPPD